MEHQEQRTILITGITGFLASWILKYCLQELPNHKIRGSARSKTSPKLEALKKEIGDELFGRVEIVEVDLNDGASLQSAMEGVHTVIHTASPINQNEFSKYEDYINPVKEGTAALLEGALKHKVQRLVVTSSCLTVFAGLTKADPALYDESDFAPLTNRNGYVDSKILEEQIIREWQEKNQDSGIDIRILNPGLILGPSIVDQGSYSTNFASALLYSKVPTLLNVLLPIVDVRDVARGHVVAATKDQLDSKRIIIVQKVANIREIAGILHENYAKFGYPVVHEHSEEADPANPYVHMHGRVWDVNNSLSKKELGLTYETPFRDVVLDLAESMINKGIIENKKQ